MTQLPDTSTEAGQREASVMLARLCGWLTSDGSWHRYIPPSGAGASVNHAKGQEITTIFALCPTLYNPANMALAWRVLNWASNNMPGKTGQRQKLFRFIRGAETYGDKMIVSMPPTDAQRAWLDKILTLAVEAGMI